MFSAIPLWVFCLFFALLYLGIKACFKRVIRIQVLLIMPAIFAWFSVENLYHTAHSSPIHVIFYAAGALLGLYFGYYHVRKVQVRADIQQHIAEIPGDWTILVLIMVIFFTQYIIHYLLAVDPSFTKNAIAAGIILAVSGFITAMVIARNLTYFYKYTQAPHEHLTITRSKFFK